MKFKGRVLALTLGMIIMLSSVAFASNLTLMPPTDSQKYRPLGARNTTVYAVNDRNTYLACKVNVDVNEIDSAYLFINQNLPYNEKFDVSKLSKGVKIDKSFIIESYVVLNMKDYKSIVESNTPNRIVVAIQKTDGTLEFSNILLIVIASGDMDVVPQQSGNKVVYSIIEGYLPIDPSTIVVTSNGKDVPYYYNNHDKTVTVFATKDSSDIKFEVNDLKGAKVSLTNTFSVSDIMGGDGVISRVQLASLISDLIELELPAVAKSYADVDYIPYELRTVVTALMDNGYMNEYAKQNKFDPNGAATHQMVADTINKYVGRAFYTPTNPDAGITMSEAIQIILDALANE